MTPRALKRFLGLTPTDRWLAARAFVWLALVDLRLRLAGFQAVVQWADAAPVAPTQPMSAERWQRAQHYAFWIAVTARRHPARARCLHRSLLLHRWLRQDGLPSVLRIGVRKEGGALRAHAWVELEGQVVNDQPAAVAAFRPLHQVAAAATRVSQPNDLRGLSWS